MNSKVKKQAVIFDCDGVMFDSRQANINYYNHLLAHFDQPLMTEEMITHVHMNTANESILHIFQQAPHLIDDALKYAKQVDYSPFVKHMIIEPGLKELLLALRPDYGLAVATNRSTTINKVLASNGLNKSFDIVVSSLDVSHPKPHPESLFKILDFFGVQSKEAFYIGDSLIDYQTAKGAGVIFIAYKNKNLKADYHSDSMGNVLDILRGDLQEVL